MITNNNYTREEISETLHTEFGLTKKDCNMFVNDILEIIIEGLQKNGFVKIHNFGSFKVKRKKMEDRPRGIAIGTPIISIAITNRNKIATSINLPLNFRFAYFFNSIFCLMTYY